METETLYKSDKCVNRYIHVSGLTSDMYNVHVYTGGTAKV